MAVGFLDGSFRGNDGIIVPLEFTNSICFGQTGSGKTTGYILPNIQSRLEEGHAVIVFDYKGNLHSHIKRLAKTFNRLGDVVEIGPIWGHKINLLLNIATKDIEQWYRSLFGKDSRYGYWEIASCNLLKTLYCVQRFLHDVHGTLQHINGYCSDVEPLETERPPYPTFASIGAMLDVNVIHGLMEKFKAVQRYLLLAIDAEEIRDEDRNTLLFYIEESEHFNAFLSRYSKLKEEDSGGEYGNHGVMSSLLNTIQEGIESDVVNGESFDLPHLVSQKKIIIIYSDTLGEPVARLLNQRIFTFLTRRTIFLKDIQPVTIFIDEAHRVLIPGSLPEVSLCRENCFEYIMSVQDRVLLENTLGVQAVDEMMVNIAHQVSFKNDNISTCSTLEPFCYRSLTKNARFGKAEPLLFDKDELADVVREYQRLSRIFERFTDIEQNDGYLVHDVEKSNDYIAIYINANNEARELRAYDKCKLRERWEKTQKEKNPQESRRSLVKMFSPTKISHNHQTSNDNHVKDAIDDFSKIVKQNLDEFRHQILTAQEKEKKAVWDEIDKIYAILFKH